MPAVPEFILRKLFVQGSLKTEGDGFCFALNNTFAPATVRGFHLEVNGQAVPAACLSLQAGEGAPQAAEAISPEQPFPFSVGVEYTVHVSGVSAGKGRLRLQVDTVEAGPLSFTIQARGAPAQAEGQGAGGVRRWLRRAFPPAALKAEVLLDAQAVIGPVHPYVYGHFIEHLERCVYGGVWSQDGSRLRPDTLALIQALRPPLVRYPGGNFASGYHWEDGIGPKEQRPPRFDQAWNAPESNQVGTDEFMAFCAKVGCDPFLVVNDGSGTPEEAARWVAYCNQPAQSEQGQRRAANGQAAPYNVHLWGVGNEVWGEWQIGHTGPQAYTARLRQFAQAMRQADPTIRIVAVGSGVLSDAPDDPGRIWNRAVLEGAGDLIDDLSFHLYQPDREGWQERYDLEALHHSVCAAPLTVESIVRRMAAQIATHAPGRRIGVAFDEWNLWLPPPADAQSMHQVVYTLRDALYAAGMFNAFHRQCQALSMANLAQLVNVLPLIVTDERSAYVTPLYHAFRLYQHMQPLALRPQVQVAAFDSPALGNIDAQSGVPYLDVTATRDQAGQRLVLGVVNRHPQRAVRARLSWRGFAGLRPGKAWLLSATDPLAANSFAAPQSVNVREAAVPQLYGDGWEYEFPACSVSVQVFEAA
ncbi:MAG: alpha-L-arabinofuranosidase C-terminal domain-containing protein [Chloroflexota bacterium]